VLEQVIALAKRCILVPLLGNHEEMLLAALEGQSELRYWLKFGGTEALASYGYKAGPEPRSGDLRGLDFGQRSWVPGWFLLHAGLHTEGQHAEDRKQ